ncbi:hypothetical protein GW17_00060485, partial [Ensete ventricosum]
FAKGIRKLIGNIPGDRWRKTVRLITRIPEAPRLAGVIVVPSSPRFSGDCRRLDRPG